MVFPRGRLEEEPTQEIIPDIVGDLPGFLLGHRTVVADGATQGEHHLDVVIPLARDDVVA